MTGIPRDNKMKIIKKKCIFDIIIFHIFITNKLYCYVKYVLDNINPLPCSTYIIYHVDIIRQ